MGIDTLALALSLYYSYGGFMDIDTAILLNQQEFYEILGTFRDYLDSLWEIWIHHTVIVTIYKLAATRFSDL